MANDQRRLKSQFMSSEGSELRFLDVQLEASSDGMRTGSDIVIDFCDLQFEDLW